MSVRLYLSSMAVLLGGLCSAGGQPPAQPNVLILLADDLGWNGVGFHGKGATTPSLDQLAKEGTELQRFYTFPVCSPARAALLTGQMPRRFGLSDVIGPQQAGIPPGTPTLPAAFHAAGYSTALIGKWHLGSVNPPMKYGFDHFYGFIGPDLDYFNHTDHRGSPDFQRDGTNIQEAGYSTYLFADEAIRQIRARDPAKPFFIEVAFNAPHVPISAPDELVAKHQHAGNGAVYEAVIEAMDLAIGRILKTIDEEKLRNDTIVLFYSDNGASRRFSDNTPLRLGKGTVYEGGIRTPCVVRWPGQIMTNAISRQPVSGMDWFATLAAAAGVPLPRDVKLDGCNQWPPLRDGKRVDRAPVLIAAYDVALIDGDWKLIETGDGKRELFHLEDDISETNDQSAKQPALCARLATLLHTMTKDLPPAGKPPPRPVPGGGRGGLQNGSAGAGPRRNAGSSQ